MLKQVTERRIAGMGRKSLAISAVAALALSLTACGASSDSGDSGKGDSSAASLKGKSMDELYKAAKAAGEDSVMIYTILSEKDLSVIAAPFEAKYPGIKVKNYEGTGEEVAAKLIEETNSGIHTADVLDSEQNPIFEVAKTGALADYTPPVAADFDKQFKNPQFTGFRLQIKTLTYNTKKISAAEAPKDYKELLDPKWKGQICAEESEIPTFALMIQEWGKDEAVDYWKGLVDNGLRFINGQTTLINSVISGDCSIAVTANVHGVEPEMANGAPITWVKTDPMFANYGAVSIAKDAPHPAAARLWANYLLSPEGQAGVAANWRIPVNPAVEPKEKGLKDRSSYKVLVAGEDITETTPELTKLYYTSTDRPYVGG